MTISDLIIALSAFRDGDQKISALVESIDAGEIISIHLQVVAGKPQIRLVCGKSAMLAKVSTLRKERDEAVAANVKAAQMLQPPAEQEKPATIN